LQYFPLQNTTGLVKNQALWSRPIIGVLINVISFRANLHFLCC